jgi:ferric-dicitrate binding protein FerR (iron transport regulator)
MENERYLFLVTREITGEITPEEKVELEALLKVDPELQERYKILDKFWRQEVYSDQSTGTDEALKKVLGRINEPDQTEPAIKTFSLSIFYKLAAAAMVIISIGIGVYVYQAYREPDQVAMIDKSNGTGTRSMITLPDGTRVWLNAESKITYPEIFDENKREVHLTGEAFFNVAHNAEKPFYIRLNKAAIRVIGTSFNVKAYSNDESIQTSVVSGKVAFLSRPRDAKSSDSVLLVKNNKVTYSLATGDMHTETVNTLDDREWINGKLIYKSETLESITRQLERNFGKKVTIKDAKVGQYRFTGTFDESSLDEIMRYLAMTRPFKYTITEKTLVIY